MRLRQFSLRTLLLLTAAVAVWVAYAKNRHDNEYFAKQIEVMGPLARQLIVEDPRQITVIKQEERWYDENEWKIHLPTGSYRLCVATRDIDTTGLAPITQSTSIAPGTHDVALEQKQMADKRWRVIVTVDGEEALRIEELADWNSGRGSTGGGQFSKRTQLLPDRPVVLFRRRFLVETSPGNHSTPKEPCNGLLIWVAPEK